MMDSSGRTISVRPSCRGQSETFGFILIFGVIIAGAVTIAGLGAIALSDTGEQLSEERAEKALTQLDSKAGLVALGQSDSQRISFATEEGGNFGVDEDSGWISITIKNRTTQTDTVLLNQSLGAVTYERDDSKLAYQGGGVWRATGGGGQMVSPPDFHYRNGTLTLPIVALSGDASLGTRVDISKDGESRVFPTSGSGLQNPLDDHIVRVTVGSEYYVGWGQYFEERTDGAVAIDHEAQTATLTLVVEAQNPAVEGALISGTPNELDVKQNAEFDSYDSRDGDYASTVNTDTRIVVAGDLHVSNNAIVDGNVEADGDVHLEKNGEINKGNVSYGGTVGGPGWPGSWNNDSHNWVNKNASVESPDPVDLLIEQTLGDFKSSNDNGNATDIDGSNELNCNTCELTSGTYYVDGLSGFDTLTFDTSDGDINIAVNGSLSTDNNDQINIEGDHRVNVYLKNEMTLGQNVGVGNRTTDNSSQFWVYMNPDESVDVENNAIFVGIIYGPGGQGKAGTDITFLNNAEVFGATVGDVDTNNQNALIHFDESLAEVETIQREQNIVRITYLHVTVNRIRLDGS